jgi:hypothetical protein
LTVVYTKLISISVCKILVIAICTSLSSLCVYTELLWIVPFQLVIVCGNKLWIFILSYAKALYDLAVKVLGISIFTLSI